MPKLRWMPYSNFNQLEYQSQPVWSSNRDLWSLGIVILEIIVGPEWIEEIKTGGDLYEILEAIKPLIGQDLHYLVNWMTLMERKSVVETMVLRRAAEDHARLSYAIQQVELAKGKTRAFQAFLLSMSEKDFDHGEKEQK